MHIDQYLGLFRRKILDMATERAIALGRFAIVLTCLAAVWISPPPQVEARTVLMVVLCIYAVFAGVLALKPRLTMQPIWALVEHGVDIAVTGFLIFVTDGSASAFFSLFMFNLIVSLLRWNWRGALSTGAITASSLFLLPARFQVTDRGLTLLDADLSRVIALGGSLVICGMMLAYLGAHRERSRRRFEQLASWPTLTRHAGATTVPAAALAHVAMMLQAPRVLLIWEEAEEPVRHVCFWDNGRIERQELGPDVYGPLADADLPSVAFLSDGGALDPALRERYGISEVLTAGFERLLCSGRLFVLDQWTWSEEDSALTELITERITLDLEERIMRRQLDTALVSQERMRLGRDLHDGLLQDLAAANIQLKLVADQVPLELKNRLETVRNILKAETNRVRTFVEDHRHQAPTPANTSVRDHLDRRAVALVKQWNCALDVAVDPPGATLPVFIVKQLEHVFGEATSNAVRHGGASQVSFDLSSRADSIEIRIRDDGRGFAGADGFVQSGQPVTTPLSLASRVEELGGRIRVANGSRGGDIEIHIPR